jgi:hypothetical protein
VTDHRSGDQLTRPEKRLTGAGYFFHHAWPEENFSYAFFKYRAIHLLSRAFARGTMATWAPDRYLIDPLREVVREGNGHA